MQTTDTAALFAGPLYVAGHRGLVGAAITRALQQQGHTVLTRTHGRIGDVHKFQDAGVLGSVSRDQGQPVGLQLIELIDHAAADKEQPGVAIGLFTVRNKLGLGVLPTTGEKALPIA